MTAASDDPLDVLVVGAGPTGLTLAAQLQALGATVRIVDRQLDRVHESRALAVQPRTLEVLRGLGVTGRGRTWACAPSPRRARRLGGFLAATSLPGRMRAAAGASSAAGHHPGVP